MYIINVDGIPAGFFDFEKSGDAGHFVIYLSREFRGKGLASIALAKAMLLGPVTRISVLDVGVEKDNVASISMLEKAGFTLSGQDEEGMLIYLKKQPRSL